MAAYIHQRTCSALLASSAHRRARARVGLAPRSPGGDSPEPVRREQTTTLSDGELARRVSAAGPSEDAEAELCRRFARRVRLFGLRHLSSAAAADDLTQDVLALMLAKLRGGEVREPERIASFVLGTARMMCRNRQRRAQRERPLEDELSEGAAEPDPLAAKRLAHALEQLDERERSVVMLTYYGEASAKDIARALSLSQGNVRVIRHRAIARLRHALSSKGEVST